MKKTTKIFSVLLVIAIIAILSASCVIYKDAPTGKYFWKTLTVTAEKTAKEKGSAKCYLFSQQHPDSDDEWTISNATIKYSINGKEGKTVNYKTIKLKYNEYGDGEGDWDYRSEIYDIFSDYRFRKGDNITFSVSGISDVHHLKVGIVETDNGWNGIVWFQILDPSEFNDDSDSETGGDGGGSSSGGTTKWYDDSDSRKVLIFYGDGTFYLGVDPDIPGLPAGTGKVIDGTYEETETQYILNYELGGLPGKIEVDKNGDKLDLKEYGTFSKTKK